MTVDLAWPDQHVDQQQTYCQSTLSHPQLLEQGAALQSLNLCQLLTHNGEVTEIWEEGKPNHVGQSREKDLQGVDAGSILCERVVRRSIFCTLLNKKAPEISRSRERTKSHRDLHCVSVTQTCKKPQLDPIRRSTYSRQLWQTIFKTFRDFIALFSIHTVFVSCLKRQKQQLLRTTITPPRGGENLVVLCFRCLTSLFVALLSIVADCGWS